MSELVPTKDVPKDAGFYWLRFGPKMPWQVIELVQSDYGLLVSERNPLVSDVGSDVAPFNGTWIYHGPADCLKVEWWAGPIELPQIPATEQPEPELSQ